MARLTFDSLTAELAAQGISLTQEKCLGQKGYTIVMKNGYSFWESTLARAVVAIEYNRAYDAALLTPHQVVTNTKITRKDNTVARLTIASLTSDLAAHGISLTGKTGAYTTVVSSGFSVTHKTLTEVKLYTDEYLRINSFVYSVDEPTAVKAECTGNICPATLPELEDEIQTEPTEAEAANAQATRVNQLASFYMSTTNEDLDWLPEDISPRQQEEEIATELVRQADKRREERKLEAPRQYRTLDMYASYQKVDHYRTTPGFDKNHKYTTRVSAKLQRRANRFHNSLAAA